MKDKPAYSFEFQKETIENLFKYLVEQGPPKKTPKPGPVTDKSLKFTRRGSGGATNRIRIKEKKQKNCCTGSEGVDFVVLTHGFSRTSACNLLESCRRTGFIASRNPYEKFKDSDLCIYFKVGPQDLLNMVLDFEQELKALDQLDVSNRAKQFEKRFLFTSKIIKALFLDGTIERERDRESQSRDSGNKSDSEDRSTRAKSGSIGGEGSADSGHADRISTNSKSDPDLRHTVERKNETRGKDFPERSGSKSAPSHLKFSKEQLKLLAETGPEQDVPSMSREDPNAPETEMSKNDSPANSDQDSLSCSAKEEFIPTKSEPTFSDRLYTSNRSSTSRESLIIKKKAKSYSPDYSSHEEGARILWTMGLMNGELSEEDNDYFDMLGEVENKSSQGSIARGRSDSMAKSLKSSERLNEEIDKLKRLYPDVDKKKYKPKKNFILKLKHDIEYVRGRTVHIFLSQDFAAWQSVDEKERSEFEEEYIVENEFTIFDQSTFMLDTYDDYYKCEIFLKNQPHTNWLGRIPDNETENAIISIINSPGNEKYTFIVNTKAGFVKHEILKNLICSNPSVEGKELLAMMEAYLDENYITLCPRDKFKNIKEKMHFQQIRDYVPFMEEIMELESSFGIKRKLFSISVVYAKHGQKAPEEMLSNRVSDMSDAAKTFFSVLNVTPQELSHSNLLSKEFTWNGFDMNLNLATKMDAEQVRRLVGNDNCIVIFVDEGGVFNPILSNEFGLMPQFFVVVQPHGSKYRVGGFYRKNVGSFNPMFTKGLIDREDLLDFVLAKCYNGLLKCLTCPPLSSLIERPRSHAVSHLVGKYQKQKRFLYPRYHKIHKT